MEISSRVHQERENNNYQKSCSPMNSPKSNVSNCMSSSNNTCTPPLTPKTIPRSDNSNPYPTTFVQADTSTFKQVVQMLTGSSETTTPTPKTSLLSSSKQPQPQHHQQPQDLLPSRNFNIPPIKTAPKKQGFKLYERRNSIKNSLMLNTIMPNYVGFSSSSSSSSPFKHAEILSPSLLDFPSLVLSPVTPLNDDDPFDKSSSSPSLGNSSEEDKAIAQKGYYLHPSPITTPRDSEPQLLPLFPVSSPRVSESPS